MEKKIPASSPAPLKHNDPSPKQRQADITFSPNVLPLYLNPKVKLSKEGRIENVSEFETINDVFDFSRCLQCFALYQEHYGSAGECQCIKCLDAIEKIREINHLRRLVIKDFQSHSPI